MSEERFLNIEHTLEKADDDLTALTKEVETLKKTVSELDSGMAEYVNLLHQIVGFYGSAEANLNAEKLKSFNDIKSRLTSLQNRFRRVPPK